MTDDQPAVDTVVVVAASYVVPLDAIGRLLRELTGAQPISQ